MKTTTHADLRARKRMGVSDVSKIFAEALEKGVYRKDLKGTFARYIDKLSITHKSTPVIYKNTIYWHDSREKTLITVIPLHQKWFKYLKDKS